MAADQDPVLVVGAGPVGMTAALALRAHRLPVAVLEADPSDRTRPGSRALFVHRQSLRLLERTRPGLGRTIAAYGTTWRARRTLYRDREVYARNFTPPTEPGGGLPPFVSLRQVDTERFLYEACRAAGVEFHWGATVREVTVGDDAVLVTAEDGRSWRSSHAIAADGAHSTVRTALGIEMEGSRSDGYHVVVDVAEPPGAELPVERVFHYEHPGVGGRSVMRVPFTGGFQVDLQCHADDPPEKYATEEAVRDWLPAVVGEDYAESILWVSKYHFLRKVAGSFTDPGRRVLLVGEAAHLFPPFGARGMNSGFADAAAAAAAVAAASSEPEHRTATVDDFATTRRQAACFNSAAAGRALAHLRPRRWSARAKQRAAAALAPVVPRCGAWLDRAPYGPRHGPSKDPERKY
jgi:3-(3-hydroxy-phenyl)propionate hydroxylase